MQSLLGNTQNFNLNMHTYVLQLLPNVKFQHIIYLSECVKLIQEIENLYYSYSRQFYQNNSPTEELLLAIIWQHLHNFQSEF